MAHHAHSRLSDSRDFKRYSFFETMNRLPKARPGFFLGRASAFSVGLHYVLLGVLLAGFASGCTSRKPRWNYGSAEQGSSAASSSPAARAALEPDAMERLFVDHGCTACHTFHGERLVGPPLERVRGGTRVFRDGSTANVDTAYLVESILEPSRRVMQGYDDVMPSYADRIDEPTAEALAAYLLALR